MRCRNDALFCGSAAYIRSTQALSSDKGSSDARIPISSSSGGAGLLSQSQSTDRLFIRLIYKILFSRLFITAPAASAMDSRKVSCTPPHGLLMLLPVVCIQHFPAVDAIPMDMFFIAPP